MEGFSIIWVIFLIVAFVASSISKINKQEQNRSNNGRQSPQNRQNHAPAPPRAAQRGNLNERFPPRKAVPVSHETLRQIERIVPTSKITRVDSVRYTTDPDADRGRKNKSYTEDQYFEEAQSVRKGKWS